jgi:hypothetical protein
MGCADTRLGPIIADAWWRGPTARAVQTNDREGGVSDPGPPGLRDQAAPSDPPGQREWRRRSSISMPRAGDWQRGTRHCKAMWQSGMRPVLTRGWPAGVSARKARISASGSYRNRLTDLATNGFGQFAESGGYADNDQGLGARPSERDRPTVRRGTGSEIGSGRLGTCLSATMASGEFRT